jgi:hypothetical protein
MPFFFVMILALALFIIFPKLSLLLPELMM